MNPIPGFKHFTTHHCITGSLRHVYEFYRYPISEEMLLGLGAGVGFIYWHTKGTLPFLGGRANTGRPGEEGLEKTAGRCTGVQVESFRTDSKVKAENSLLKMLSAGQPVMLMVDMGFMPYFNFGGHEYHFGGHAVVACGYEADSRQVLLADRDNQLHPVPWDALARARGSTFQPFPPHHAWFQFDFSQKRSPQPDEILQAVRQCAQFMLDPPITNIGVKGIRKAAVRIGDWLQTLGEKTLRAACFNSGIMIDARGGTGGGLFRYMYGRFLHEAAAITGQADFMDAGTEMLAIGECWQEVASLFERASQSAAPAQELEFICRLLPDIAGREEQVWTRLDKIVRQAS